MLLSNLVDGFLLDCRTRNLSERTIDVYGNALQLLSERIGDKDVDAITLNELREYSRYLQSRKSYSAGNHPWMKERDEQLSAWTVHAYLRPVKTLFAWSVSEGVLDANPAERLGLPKLPKGRVDRFTDDEIDTLLDASRTISYRDYAIVFLLLDSGLRRSELVDLDTGDVDLKTGVVTVRHGKGDKHREVRVGNACRKTLWVYVHKHRQPSGDETQALFVSDNGERFTSNALGCFFLG